MSDYTRSTVSTINGVNAETAKIQTAVNSKLDKSGGAFTGTVDMNEQRLINLPEPVGDSEPMPFGTAKAIVIEATNQADRAEAEADRAESEADRAFSEANRAESYADDFEVSLEPAKTQALIDIAADVAEVDAYRISSKSLMDSDVSQVEGYRQQADTDINVIVGEVVDSRNNAQSVIDANVQHVRSVADFAVDFEIPAQLDRLGLEYPPIPYAGGLVLTSNTKTYSYLGAIYVWGGLLGTETNGLFTEDGWQVLQGDLQLRNDVTEGTLLIRDIKHVDSVSALQLLEGKYNGQIVQLSGYYSGSLKGGGRLVWDSASTATADNALVFAVTGVPTGRWVRVLEDDGFLNPYNCGAYGDAVEDDSAAVQLALSNLYTEIPRGNFRCEAPINTESSATTLMAKRLPNVGRDGLDCELVAAFDGPSFFSLDNTNFSTYGVTYGRAEGSTDMIALYSPQPESATTPSRDVIIDNCSFKFFSTCYKIEGRGLKFTNNEIAGAKTCVELDWGVGFEDPRENTHGTQGGFRAFTIAGNRVHTADWIVTNIGANRKWISAITIADNLSDIGSGLFKGVLRRGSLVNNVVNLARDSATGIDLWGDSESYTIDNFVYAGSFIPEGDYEIIRSLPNYAMVLRGSQRQGDIGSVTAANLNRQALRIEADAVLSDITVSKLVARDVAISNPAFGVITNVSGSTGAIRIKEIQVSQTATPASPIPIIAGTSGMAYVLDSVPAYDPAKFTLRSGGRVYVPFAGRINTDGSLVAGPAFLSGSRASAGVYTVTHNLGHTSATESIITANAVSTGRHTIGVSATQNSFTVYVTDEATGLPADAVVNFNYTTTKN